MKRSRSEDLNGAGMIINSSLGMPSGPADLLRFRDDNVLLKVNWRRTYGRRVWWVSGVLLEGESFMGSMQPGISKGYGSVGFSPGSHAHSLVK